MSRPSSIIKHGTNVNVNINDANDITSEKSVRFHPSLRFILTHPSNGGATGSSRSSQPSLTRYTDDDYKRIRKSIKKTARAVRSFHREHPDGNFDEHQQTLAEAAANDNDDHPEPQYTDRGLEHLRTAECLERQMINKDCAIEAVLAAQERLDDEEDEADVNDHHSANASDPNSLDQRLRGISNVQTSNSAAATATMARLEVHRLRRLDHRARCIAASYRVHNRWALQNALDLAAQDELYVEQHVRPALEQELHEFETERQQQQRTPAKSCSAMSPLRTFAALQESLVMNGTTRGDNDNEGGTGTRMPPSSSLSAATVANMMPRASRPHAPSQVLPPANWLQHRDSLRLLPKNHTMMVNSLPNVVTAAQHQQRQQPRRARANTIDGTATMRAQQETSSTSSSSPLGLLGST